MGNFVIFGATDHLGKGMFENAEQFVGHFRFGPKEALQALNPFEIGNNHAAGVAKNIGNHKDLIPPVFQN